MGMLHTADLIDMLVHDRLTAAQREWLLHELAVRSNDADETATAYLEAVL